MPEPVDGGELRAEVVAMPEPVDCGELRAEVVAMPEPVDCGELRAEVVAMPEPVDCGELRAEAPFRIDDLVELMRADTQPKGRPHDHEAVDHVARYVARYAEQAELARSKRTDSGEAMQRRVQRAWVERERRLVAGDEEQGRVEHVARVLTEVELPYTELPLEPRENHTQIAPEVLIEDADDAPVAYRHQQVERRCAARSGRHSGSGHGVVRPVGMLTWLALSAGLGLGVLMLQRTQALWMQIIGFLLLLALVPVSGFVVTRAIKRGFGSPAAVSIAGFFFVLATLRLSYFF